MATMLRWLAHRNFRLFFIGQGMSLIGTWMQTTAMAWLVNSLTAPPGSNQGDPFWLAMIVFATQIPGLFLGPISGVITDRFRRRPILYLTQTLMMLQAFVLAWLAFSGIIQVWHLIALGGFLGVVSTFDVTARQAFLTQMVGGNKDDLANAIALNSSLFNGARLIGPALAGGLLMLGIGEGTCFLLNGVSYLAVLGGLWLMRLHEPRPAVATRGWPRWWTRPLHLRLAAHSRHPSSGGGRQPCRYAIRRAAADLRRPQFARRRRNVRPVDGRVGRRSVGGSSLYGGRKSVLGLGRVIAATPAFFGLGLIVFALSTTLWLSLSALALMGFAVMTQAAASNTILQTIVDDDKRGRVMSFYATAFLGFAPIGHLAAGGLAEWFGAPLTVAAGGVVCMIASLVFAGQVPRIREHIRPIYRRIGILPELVQGIQEASEPRGVSGRTPARRERERGFVDKVGPRSLSVFRLSLGWPRRRGRFENLDFALESVAQSILLHFQIVTGLQIQPEMFRRTEVAPSRSGVLALTERDPRTISLIRRGGTLTE